MVSGPEQCGGSLRHRCLPCKWGPVASTSSSLLPTATPPPVSSLPPSPCRGTNMQGAGEWLGGSVVEAADTL